FAASEDRGEPLMSKHADPASGRSRAEQPPAAGQPGKVYLVGAGPGDPELLTLKAARLLGQAQAVVFDHLVGEGVLDLVNPAARRVYAGKEAGNHALPQERINTLL